MRISPTRIPYILLSCLGILWTAATLAAVERRPSPATQDARSVWTGVYSEAQAQRGSTVYGESCARCHGKALEGGDAAALTGKEFLLAQDGKTLDKLFKKILETMPDDDPGSMKPPQVADVTAYILNVNKFPAGTTELPAEADPLKQIKFEVEKPKH